MRRLAVLVFFGAGLVPGALAAPFTATELMKLKRLADPRLSPDGQWTYDAMLRETTHLAILDLNMPDMTGPDVIKLYRAGEVGATKRLPILVLSADATPAAREESMAAGASEFLTKPVTAQTLLAAIHRLVGGRPFADEQTGKVPPLEAVPCGDNRAQTTTAERFELQQPSESHVPAGVIIDADRLHSLRRMANFDQRFLESYVTAAIGDLEQAVAELRVAVPSRNTVLARSALSQTSPPS